MPEYVVAIFSVLAFVVFLFGAYKFLSQFTEDETGVVIDVEHNSSGVVLTGWQATLSRWAEAIFTPIARLFGFVKPGSR